MENLNAAAGETRRPLLSVCVPTFNRAGYLAATLDSLTSQPFFQNSGEGEIVISDNGSTDGTADVIKSFQAKFPHKIKSLRQAATVSAAANFALVLEAGRGEALKLHNDTLIVRENFWEEAAALVRAHRAEKPVLFFLNGRRRGLRNEPETRAPNLNAFIDHVSYLCTWIGAFALWAEDAPRAVRLFREAPHCFAQTEALFDLLSAGRPALIYNPEFGASPPDVPKHMAVEHLRSIYVEQYLGLLDKAAAAGSLAEDARRREVRRFFFLFYAPQLARMRRLTGYAWGGLFELGFIRAYLGRLSYAALYPYYLVLGLAFNFLRRSGRLQNFFRWFL